MTEHKRGALHSLHQRRAHDSQRCQHANGPGEATRQERGKVCWQHRHQ